MGRGLLVSNFLVRRGVIFCRPHLGRLDGGILIHWRPTDLMLAFPLLLA